jgi:hypothetical protein
MLAYSTPQAATVEPAILNFLSACRVTVISN